MNDLLEKLQKAYDKAEFANNAELMIQAVQLMHHIRFQEALNKPIDFSLCGDQTCTCAQGMACSKCQQGREHG